METQWKQADDKTKLSVLGYTRRIMNKLKGWNVPLSVQYYCISYYYLTDYFTEHGRNITINKNGNIAEVKTNRYRRHTVYGNELIDLTKQPKEHGSEWKWTFKISQIDCDSPGFWIGINNTNKEILNDIVDTHYNDNHIQYASYSISNRGNSVILGKSWSTIPWGKEAIIEMKIIPESKKHWVLKFFIDSGARQDMIPYPIQVDAKYHLAVVLSEKGQKIEILNFDNKITKSSD